jgi:hypothetical protein
MIKLVLEGAFLCLGIVGDVFCVHAC